MANVVSRAKAGEGQARIVPVLAAALSLLVASFAGTMPAPLPILAQAERSSPGIDAPRPGAAAAIRQFVGLPSAGDARDRSERALWRGGEASAVRPDAAPGLDLRRAATASAPIAEPQRASVPVAAARPRGPPAA
ncbi:MAG: hypothetical protein JNK11_05795 [Alphaproteobacteria bacterium]|nr:hypothetical protein [Alphaproteobacteria bacterium]